MRSPISISDELRGLLSVTQPRLLIIVLTNKRYYKAKEEHTLELTPHMLPRRFDGEIYLETGDFGWTRPSKALHPADVVLPRQFKTYPRLLLTGCCATSISSGSYVCASCLTPLGAGVGAGVGYAVLAYINSLDYRENPVQCWSQT